MSFRSLREQKLLSQERLAEISGLSLRTIQRVEAGHRVSYASLRALAATFEIDVDQLERELYAMSKSTDDFIEVPRWVRLVNDSVWIAGPRPSRRHALMFEAFVMGSGFVFLAASFLVPSDGVATMLRIAAVFELFCGYVMSLGSRLADTYKLWPSSELAWQPRGPLLHSRLFAYTFCFSVAGLFLALVLWLA
jgi:transcriptional regulator with XRE-family HTH domain